MKKVSKKNLDAIKVTSTEDGLQLDGSILWFDSKQNGDLSFLSSAGQYSTSKVPQVIATEETIKIVEAKRQRKPNALICQYNRPFSIGKLKMELLPSGTVLGGASLYVENDRNRILYAPQLQVQKTSTVRQMQLKKASTLIIGAFHTDLALPNRKKEKERLVRKVKAYLKKQIHPIILCSEIGTAQEVTKLLTDEELPVAVHRTIYKINRVYEAYGSQLGNYTCYSEKHTKNKILIFPLSASNKRRVRTRLPQGPVLYIQDNQDVDQFIRRGTDEVFNISSVCDSKEMREVIAAVAPKEVYVFGPYAKQFSEDLKGSCKSVKPLFTNDQPTLF